MRVTNRIYPIISTDEASRHLALIRTKSDDERTVYEEAAIHFIQGTEATAVNDQHSRAGSIIRSYSSGAKARYYKALTNAKRALDLAPKVVYAPGHGNDISHCEVFYNADRIINLDVDPHAVELMRKLYADVDNVESHLGYAETFIPDDPADLLIIFGRCFDLNKFDLDRILVKNGYLITNFSESSPHKELELLGTFDENGQIPNEYKESLCVRKVLTDEELQKSGKAYGHDASYAEVSEIVYKLTGKISSLIETYNGLRDLAIAQHIERVRKRHQSPEYKKQLEEAGITDYVWPNGYYEEMAKEFKQRKINLYFGNEEFILKPLPFIQLGENRRKYDCACVYKNAS